MIIIFGFQIILTFFPTNIRYIPSSGVLRLSKSDLDGASSDSKFDEEFFVDLIFAPIEQSNTTRKVGDSRSNHESSDVLEEIDVIDIQNNRSQGIEDSTNNFYKFESTTASNFLLPPPSKTPSLVDVVSRFTANASTVNTSLISDSGEFTDISNFIRSFLIIMACFIRKQWYYWWQKLMIKMIIYDKMTNWDVHCWSLRASFNIQKN